MSLPSNWFYKDGGYWAPDGSGPYVMTDTGVMQLVGSGGSGSTYLGPMTFAELQSSAYADGSVGLAALAADASVFVTDRRVVMIPNAAKTSWTVGSAGEVHSVADLAARQTAGVPVPINTLLIDPATNLMYGQSDGAGGYVALGGSVPSSEYHTHFYAPLAIDSDRKARDISGALSHGNFQANLSAAAAWATAGFLTQPNPSVASELSMVEFPAISWNWADGDSLFVFWCGRGTPEASDAPLLADTYGYSFGNGTRIMSTTAGKVKVNFYQNSGSLTVGGPVSSATVFEAGVTHSFAMCFRPHVSGVGGGICFWVDAIRNPAHASGFIMPANAPCDTTTAATLKLGGDGATSGSIQQGMALQTRALVVLKGRRGNPPMVGDMDALVAALHANPQALVSAASW